MSETALTGPLQRLIEALKKLPGVGTRSAERIAFHLLKAERDEVLALAQALTDIKDKVRPCARCFNLAEGELCHICAHPTRDQSQIVVVEQPKDLIILESTGLVRGVYHVLMGRLAPMEGVQPGDLTIAALAERCRAGGVKEVVLATNPTSEGDATALAVIEALRGLPVRITRLARGLPTGGHIEYANRSMLEEALRNRSEL